MEVEEFEERAKSIVLQVHVEQKIPGADLSYVNGDAKYLLIVS